MRHRAHNKHRRNLSQLLGTATQNTIAFKQIILLITQQHFPLMQKTDVVANLFQIARNMGRYQNGMLVILNEFHKNIQNFVAHDGVQTAGRLIKQQQLWR
ncbi:hypothetical protein SDC9_201413 [bioreactor metagenome]|uniref:Uncharacterized protein n=1 Tax=bioreactor metagenome TaxID=1076179 RepID=A0A645IR99_9ZZZZ